MMKRRNLIRNALLLMIAFFFGYAVKREGDNLIFSRGDAASERGWVDPILDFGAKGNGTSDDTDALQKAIDHAQKEHKPLISNAGKVYAISSPLYIDGNLTINFNYSTIKKTKNTAGSGSNKFLKDTYSYEVDAILIVRHPDDDSAKELHIHNIKFGSSAKKNHDYGIYAPSLASSSMENITFEWGITDIGVFGYCWWLISKFNNIRLDGGKATWVIAADKAGQGSSTSINASHIIGTEQESCFRLYGVSYSIVNIPLIDNVTNNSKYAFQFSMCSGITVNSPSVEGLRTGRFLFAEGSNIIINTPRCYNISGSDSDISYLLNIKSNSKVTINNGEFPDYISGTSAYNFPLSISDGSHCLLNYTQLPKNGNDSKRNSGTSTLMVIDENGMNLIKAGKKT